METSSNIIAKKRYQYNCFFCGKLQLHCHLIASCVASLQAEIHDTLPLITPGEDARICRPCGRVVNQFYQLKVYGKSYAATEKLHCVLYWTWEVKVFCGINCDDSHPVTVRSEIRHT